ncbi:MBL-fold metallo-hydrolase superfamily [hydrothermal vent metagenome]|uniref:MBL-fold metallo-hydrolase superfamily n=1 Tax=hydrothermal vent metagenome TaxID=652676 RepID=A0A3B0S5L3_9ZZZZ
METDYKNMLEFNKNFSPEYGEVTQVSPLIRRLVAQNPSPFTFYGTGTYIVGNTEGGASHASGGAQVGALATVAPPSRPKISIIDPGPAMASHIHALERFLETVEISHILVTHNHVDHSPAAHPLKLVTGAEIYAFDTGRQADVDNHAEEGRDQHFSPDHILHDGDVIEGDGWTLDVVHTPGHLSNHLCFGLREERALFTGDHVMGWSTSVVSQPDGDMKDYIASLEKLLDRDDEIYYPTHGAPIENPKPYVKALIAHRHNREKQILAAISGGAVTIPQMVNMIYSDIPSYLHPAAASSVLSHLIHMAGNGQVRCEGEMDKDGIYGVL